MGINAVEGVGMGRCWVGEVLNRRMNICSNLEWNDNTQQDSCSEVSEQEVM